MLRISAVSLQCGEGIYLLCYFISDAIFSFFASLLYLDELGFVLLA